MKFPLDLKLDSDRILLRRSSKEDIALAFDASRYAGFNDGMQWDPPEKMEEMIGPYERSLDAWIKDEAYTFTVEDKATREKVARISIRPGKGVNVWDTGFWTHPTFQGKGYMTEALGRLVKWTFEELEAISITGAYATWNKASGRVFEKNGFQQTGITEKGFQKNGEWIPEYEVILLRKIYLGIE
ncbi:MAG: GNAT family protein [Bacteroidota bacterium]